MDIGPTELIIILIIVVLLFGVGRVGKLGGELGSAMREFRRGLSGDDQPSGDGKSPAASQAAEPAPAGNPPAAEPAAPKQDGQPANDQPR